MSVALVETSSSSSSLGQVYDTENPLIDKSVEDVKIVQTNFFRWFILALYSFTAFSNTLVWLSLFTVTDVTCTFFNVDPDTFLWSTNAFTLIQVLLAIPVSFLPSKLGLRTAMIIAASINAIGASIMIAATNRKGFPLFVTGQTIIAIAASLLPQLAPVVSSVWFPEKEQAISTSLGVIFGNAGAAVGFLQPALLLKDINPAKNIPYVEKKLKELIYSQAILCIALLVLVILFFRKAPKHAPSKSEAQRLVDGLVTFKLFIKQLKNLLSDSNYHLCANSFALNSVLVIIVPVFLNEIMSWKFPNQYVVVGWMGFGGIIAGIVGSIIFGLVLDRTQAYKKMVLFLTTGSIFMWLGFSESLAQLQSMPLTFTLFIACTIVFIPSGPILVAIISEMTYPVPESSSYVLPITLGRFYSIPFVFLFGWLVSENRFHLVCLLIAAVLLVCMLLVAFAKITLKRKKIENNLDVQ